MAVSNIKASFLSDIKKVWETVTSLEDYIWRSDLSKIEVVSEKKFIEYTKRDMLQRLRLPLWSHINDGNLIWRMITSRDIG